MVITRRDPGLPLAQLRAEGRVNELRTRDLRFNHAETAALLEKVEGLTVSDDTLVRLEQQLEGWIVGLHLVVLALGNVDRPEELLESMSGGIRHIQEYLLQEVMAGRSPQMRDWLLKTSILDRFCEQLCTAVCAVDAPPGSTDLNGGQFVDALQRCNLFTIPLDAEGKWYRCHHLFQELLQGELESSRDPDEIAALHSRASAWFERQGLVDEALDHAIKGGHIEETAGIIERNLRPIINEGRWHVVARWLSKLPESVIEMRPEILIAHVFSSYFRMEVDKFPPILDRIDDLMGGGPNTHSLSGEVAMFRGVYESLGGSSARGLEHLEQALDQIPVTQTIVRATTELWYLLTCQMEGQRKQADQALAEWLGEKTPLHPLRHTMLLQAAGAMALIAGDLETLEQINKRKREVGAIHKVVNFLAWCDYFDGMSHLQHGHFDEAIRFLKSVSDSRYFNFVRAATDAMAALTIAYQARGLAQQAADVLESLREFTTHIGGPYAVFADSCAIRLRIMQGQSVTAVSWTGMSAAAPSRPMQIWFDNPLITGCRAMIAEGTAESLDLAHERLRAYIEFNEGHHNTFQLIGLLALQAMAFNKRDKSEEALAALGRAVELAQPGGFIFPFLELGSPMAQLLRGLPERDSHATFVKRILSAFEGTEEKVAVDDASQPRGSRPPLDQLTNRELGILELLAQRLFDKEIAAKLNISASTVNSHCKSIYQKLDVSNRRQAVAKGTELGILNRK